MKATLLAFSIASVLIALAISCGQRYPVLIQTAMNNGGVAYAETVLVTMNGKRVLIKAADGGDVKIEILK